MGFVTARSRARVYRFVLALVSDPYEAERLTRALLAEGASGDRRRAIGLCRSHSAADVAPLEAAPRPSAFDADGWALSLAAQRRTFEALARAPMPPTLLPAWQRKFRGTTASPRVDVPSS